MTTFAERLADATAAADAVCPDPRTISDRVKAFAALTWPVDIRGQQRFFSSDLPAAEADLERNLRDEFTLTELQRLRDFLAGLDLDDDDDSFGAGS